MLEPFLRHEFKFMFVNFMNSLKQMNKYNNLFYIINSLIARYFIDFCKILNQFG